MWRPIVAGLLVGGIPAIVWSALVAVNLRTSPGVPWSAVVMALLLWLFWRRYARTVRSTELPSRIWRLSLLAGGSAIAALWALFAALRPFLPIPATPSARYPIITVVAAILVSAAVAAVAEETGYRGTMQAPLERAYGPVSAIAITSILFTLAHLSHGLGILPILPFYLAAAVVYGLLAYLTDSILPSLLLHFVGDVATFTLRYAGWTTPAGRTVPFLIAAFGCAFLGLAALRVLQEQHWKSNVQR